MTIASTTSKVSYNGSGSTGPFPITFRFTKNADIVATKRSSAGIETVLTLTTHYTLTGAGDSSGGALTLVTALAVGESLVIARVPGIVQEVDYVENSAFPAETHEGALDLLTMICQSLKEQIDRSVKVEISSTTSPSDLLAELANDVAAAAASAAQADVARIAAELAETNAEAAAASIPTFGTFGLTLAATTTASNARTAMGLKSAALADTGTSVGNVPILDAGGKLQLSVIPDITGIDPATRNISIFDSFLNQIHIGRASGAIPSGFLHLFLTDELATKTNATYDATGDYYYNQAAPNGTKTALTGGMFSILGAATAYTLPNIVDGITAQNNGFGIFAGAAAGAGILIDAGVGSTFDMSSFRIFAVAGGAAAAFNVDYSTDNVNWYNLGALTTATSGWTTFTNAQTVGRYRYLRLVTSGIQAANTGYFSEFELFEFGAPTSITLIPTAITAGSAPETVDFYMLHKAIDSTTLNTDVKARVSRDNGTNWSAHVTLAELCQYDANYKLLKGTADLSALASGTSVKWEVTTLNSKYQRVRAAAMVLNS